VLNFNDEETKALKRLTDLSRSTVN